MPIEREKGEDLGAFYARILIALAMTTGGELRVKEHLIDLDTKRLLVQDFDPKTNEIVFRVMSRHAEAAWVQPRQAAWTIPIEERRAQLEAADGRGRVPTDEELAAKELELSLRRQTRPSRPIAPTTGH